MESFVIVIPTDHLCLSVTHLKHKTKRDMKNLERLIKYLIDLYYANPYKYKPISRSNSHRKVNYDPLRWPTSRQ